MNPARTATDTGTERAEHIATTILEQLAEIDQRNLSPATARHLLQLHVGRPHQERVSFLSVKAQEGTLTPAGGPDRSASLPGSPSDRLQVLCYNLPMARKRTRSTPPAPAAGEAKPSPLGASLPSGYDELLTGLKERIRSARLRAGLAVNRELVLLYWQVGREILARQEHVGWGAKVIDRLAADLRHAFPGMEGLSPRNLKYMRAFAAAWPDAAIVQGPLAQITWYHNVALLEKLGTQPERLWYARKAVEHGWSRNVLVMQIEGGLIGRQGKALTNFERTLPEPQSDLAREILKDPYNFDFLSLAEDAREREVERGLIEHLRSFLLELGAGFAFVGQQVRLEVGGEDFFLDLLFYHLKLRAYVVIEIKATAFRPEYAGKMNFYLSAVDDLLRHPEDRPSIGIILCKAKNRIIAEYALRDSSKPIGVTAFQLTTSLPEKLRGSLPTIEDLEAELGDFGGQLPAEGKPKRAAPRSSKRGRRPTGSG